jgi:hypothetical protein
MRNRYSLRLVAFGLLAGCATAPPPPLTADNPASPSAPEAIVRPPHNALGADDLTKKSHQIFAQAAKQQQQWDQSGPVSGDQQGQQMQNMPGMQMPQQQLPPTSTPQQQMDQMPGMHMPQEKSQPSPTPNNQ